jgi:23S rRNA pseudouridine2605 synthase
MPSKKRNRNQESDRRRPAKHAAKSATGPRRRRRGSPRAVSAQHVAGADRLQKVLAAAGVDSRRECEQLILDGRVEVDRQVVTELGTRVDPHKQEIRIDGEVLHQAKLVYYAVHKPEGVVCTSSDPTGRPRVIDMLPPDAPRVYCVGRLDMSSEGLILVTNDGELANGVTHPSHGVEKIYHVQVSGQLDEEGLKQIRKGMHLAEGFASVKHVRIKSRKKNGTILEMILDEGRNREIRRLFARVGHKVQRLTRIAVGPVRLGEMPAGAVRLLTKQEVSALRRAIAEGPRKKSAPKSTPVQSSKPPAKKVNNAVRGVQGGQGEGTRSIIGG